MHTEWTCFADGVHYDWEAIDEEIDFVVQSVWIYAWIWGDEGERITENEIGSVCRCVCVCRDACTSYYNHYKKTFWNRRWILCCSSISKIIPIDCIVVSMVATGQNAANETETIVSDKFLNVVHYQLHWYTGGGWESEKKRNNYI